MKRKRRVDRGLTLVEVGIAVAIVAILAAIAVPSFSWMIGRARANEAVDGLSSIYSLEQAYHFENKTYGNLVEIGYVPEGENRYAYCAGTYQHATNCVTSATDSFQFIGARTQLLVGGTVNRPGATPTPKPTAPLGNPNVQPDSFEADAYGRVGHLPAPNDMDNWLIDQNQQLVHYNVGY